MKYRTVGNSGLKVSEISLGSYITFGSMVRESDAVRILHRALDLGINSFDTADYYQYGEAETIIGKALKPIERSRCVLATKAFFPMSDDPNDRGLSRKHLVESCEKSLRRLQTDYVDIFYLHRFDHDTPLEETLRTVSDLIRQGKVLYWGVSKWTEEQMTEAAELGRQIGLPPMIAHQLEYNYFYRGIEESMLSFGSRQGIGHFAFSPLAEGVATGKYSNPEALATSRGYTDYVQQMGHLSAEKIACADRIRRYAEEIGMEPARLALAWVLRHGNIASAVVGVTLLEQLEENVKASGCHIDDEILNHLESLLKG